MSPSTRPPHQDPRATLHDGDETLEQRVARYREEQKESAADLVTLGDRVDELEELVGRPPSALPGAKGSGLSQHLVDLTLAVTRLTDRLEVSDRKRAEEGEAAGKRREPWSRVGWLAAGAAIATVVGAGIVAGLGWLATLHH